jgi:GTP-binding protein
MPAKFIKSAADFDGCPNSDLKEVAVIGRSNSGKSTLINAWTGGRLARVSQTPGKTDLINFYEIDENYMLVDLPGYGYAARSQAQKKTWTPMIEEYLASRRQLSGVLLLFDAKRPWSEDEDNMLDWLESRQRDVMLVVNKVDRLNQSERSKQKRAIEGENLPVVDIAWVSARNKTGIDELKRSVFENFLSS